MIIQGKPVESMMDPKLMELLQKNGVVYLHKSVGPEGDGWIASQRAEPDDPDSPETIQITLRKRTGR